MTRVEKKPCVWRERKQSEGRGGRLGQGEGTGEGERQSEGRKRGKRQFDGKLGDAGD